MSRTAQGWTRPTAAQISALIESCGGVAEAAARTDMSPSRLYRIQGNASAAQGGGGTPIRFIEWRTLVSTCRPAPDVSTDVGSLIESMRRVGARDLGDPMEACVWDGVVVVYHSPDREGGKRTKLSDDAKRCAVERAAVERDMISWDIGRGVLEDGRRWFSGYGQVSVLPGGRGFSRVPIVVVIKPRAVDAAPDPVVAPS